MIYLKEQNTNRIVEFQSQASIGAGFANWTRLTESEILAHELQKAKDAKIAQCKAYLNKTDWYVIRLADAGIVIPVEIVENRNFARDNQDLITACTTLEALNNININF
jgi:hypothetical protein